MMSANEQIEKLAVFIMSEVDGEPSASEGAGDTAIRVIKSLQDKVNAMEGRIMAKCTAIAKGGRINLVIRKADEGYVEFSKVFDNIEKDGVQVWYGDIEDEHGKEQSGLIITSQIVEAEAPK